MTTRVKRVGVGFEPFAVNSPGESSSNDSHVLLRETVVFQYFEDYDGLLRSLI
jgi:hypothetical protein